MTPQRRKSRDFDTVYYMGVHNCSGGEPPHPLVIRALIRCVCARTCVCVK